MNKTTLKIIALLTITVIFIYGFSSSYASRTIDNVVFVVGLAIDLADDKENLKVSFGFTNMTPFSQESSYEKPDTIMQTVTASSIDSAINLINVYLSKEVNLSHCKAIIISEEYASKGVYSEISEFINNPQIRPTTNIVVSKEDASEYFDKSASSLDKLLTRYYDIFPNSSKYTGYTANITIGELYNSILTKESGNLTILGGINTNSVQSTNPDDIKAENSSITGERGTENIGLAIFNDDKYIGDLTALETLYHSILVSEVNTFLLSVDGPNNIDKKMDINITTDTPTDISVNISNDVPIIDININLSGKILTVIDDLDYSDTTLLENISESVNTYLEKNIYDYLKKTQNDFKCDLDYFYKFAKRNFNTIEEWQNFDWQTKYTKATFNINVNCNVVSSFIVSGN